MSLILTAGCSSSGSSTSARTTLSKLSVSGNRIVNEKGEEIRLRGVDTTDPLWLEKLDFKRNGVPDNRFAEIATDLARVKALGANIIRFPLYPGYYFLLGGESYLSTYVDRMIDLAEQNGLYPGSVPKGEDQVTAWEKLFGFLASTYPVIVSEWGFRNGGDVTTNGTLTGYGKPLIDYLDQKKIHWVAHVYNPPDAEPPMLEADWTTLNEFGRFVKERLQN